MFVELYIYLDELIILADYYFKFINDVICFNIYKLLYAA